MSPLRFALGICAYSILVACSGQGIPLTKTPNQSPVIVSEEDLTAEAGVSVVIDASQSYDPEGESLDFSWALLQSPSNSNPGFDYAQDTVTLTPDVAGLYHVRISANDGELESEKTVRIFVVQPSPTSNHLSDLTKHQVFASPSWFTPVSILESLSDDFHDQNAIIQHIPVSICDSQSTDEPSCLGRLDYQISQVVSDDLTTLSSSELDELLEKKRKEPHYNIILSIGTKHSSNAFLNLVSPNNQGTFIKSIVETLKEFPIFDGVVINWMPLKNHERDYAFENHAVFASTLIQLRNALNQSERSYTLISNLPDTIDSNLYEQITPHLDIINVNEKWIPLNHSKPTRDLNGTYD